MSTLNISWTIGMQMRMPGPLVPVYLPKVNMTPCSYSFTMVKNDLEVLSTSRRDKNAQRDLATTRERWGRGVLQVLLIEINKIISNHFGRGFMD